MCGHIIECFKKVNLTPFPRKENDKEDLGALKKVVVYAIHTTKTAISYETMHQVQFVVSQRLPRYTKGCSC